MLEKIGRYFMSLEKKEMSVLLGNTTLPFYIYIPQGRTIRWTPRSLKQNIAGLYTDGFSICNIVVVYSEKGISITHADNCTLTKAIEAEVAWAGAGCEKIVYYRNEETKQLMEVCASRTIVADGKFKLEFWGNESKIRSQWSLKPVASEVAGLQFIPEAKPGTKLQVLTKEFAQDVLPATLLRHPEEWPATVATKIEELIGFGTKDFVPKQNIIFDDNCWLPLPIHELMPYHSNEEDLQQYIDFIKKDNKFMKITERLAGIREHLFGKHPQGILKDNRPDVCIKAAKYFQSFNCRQSKEAILVMGIMETLDDQKLGNNPKKYPIQNNEDANIVKRLRKLAAEKDIVVDTIQKILDDYSKTAPATNFKSYLLYNYKNQKKLYLERKEYEDLAALYKQAKGLLKSFAKEGAELFGAKEYAKARKKIEEALSFSWCCKLSDAPLIILLGNMGVCLLQDNDPEAAIYYLELTINLRKLFNVHIDQVEAFEKNLLVCRAKLKQKSEAAIPQNDTPQSGDKLLKTDITDDKSKSDVPSSKKYSHSKDNADELVGEMQSPGASTKFDPTLLAFSKGNDSTKGKNQSSFSKTGENKSKIKQPGS